MRDFGLYKKRLSRAYGKSDCLQFALCILEGKDQVLVRLLYENLSSLPLTLSVHRVTGETHFVNDCFASNPLSVERRTVRPFLV